jgi:hypothetical protein
MTGIVHGVLGASVLSSPNLHNTTLSVSGDRARTSTRPIHLAWRGSKEGEPSCPRHQKECVPFVLRSQQADGVTQLRLWDVNQLSYNHP